MTTTGPRLLEATLARLLPPGANRAGMASDAPWAALLPGPSVTDAWVIGPATAGELAGLARVADAIRLLDDRTTGAGGAARDARLAALGVEPGRVVVAAAGADAPAGSPGLLWVRAAARLRGPALDDLEARVVAGGGVVFCERVRGHAGAPGGQLRIGPMVGPVRTAHPAADSAAADIARRRGLEEFAARRWLASHGVPRPRPLLRRIVAIERAIAAHRPRAAHLAGHGVDIARPPAWLRSLALESGCDITDHAWALAAPGDYATQKVLIVLQPRPDQRSEPGGAEGGAPAIIVKLAVDPVGVPRLEAAMATLRALAALPVAAPRVPRLLFGGRVGRLGVSAEGAVDGRALDRLGPARARDAAGSLVEWFADLANATARPTSAPALREALGRIAEAYTAAYAPAPDERRAIERRIAAITADGMRVPSVFLHGDPGVQNLLVDEAGHVLVLDWENGDPAGLPVWDVAMFLRSFAVWATAGRGQGSRLAAVRRHLVEGSPMTTGLSVALEGYRRRVGIPAQLVEPLVTLGWVWLAARDAARLQPALAQRGQAVRVARLFLERGDACALFAASREAGA